MHSKKKKKKLKAKTELIDQQKPEIEKLEATQVTRISQQQLVTAIMQAIICMHLGEKKPTKIQDTGRKPYLEITRSPELSKGIDGSLHPSISCQYYKDTSHELDNCRGLQIKLACDCLATQGILA